MQEKECLVDHGLWGQGRECNRQSWLLSVYALTLPSCVSWLQSRRKGTGSGAHWRLQGLLGSWAVSHQFTVITAVPSRRASLSSQSCSQDRVSSRWVRAP